MLGGDHSIGFPVCAAIAQCTDKKIGINPFRPPHRHPGKGSRQSACNTTPWFWATNLPNVPAVNLVQLGIGGWQVPREGVQVARERNTNVLTIADIEKFGIEKSAEIALDLPGRTPTPSIFPSMSIRSIAALFRHRLARAGRFLPREALKLLGLVCAQGIADSRWSRFRRPTILPISPR